MFVSFLSRELIKHKISHILSVPMFLKREQKIRTIHPFIIEKYCIVLIINEILMDGGGGELSYAFNRFVNFTTFVPADTAQIQAVSANLRLRYTFRPDSDLYVLQRRQTLPEFRGRETGWKCANRNSQ